jgi:hypothetical protein
MNWTWPEVSKPGRERNLLLRKVLWRAIYRYPGETSGSVFNVKRRQFQLCILGGMDSMRL